MSLSEFSPMHLILVIALVAVYAASIWAIVVTITDPIYGVAEKVVWVAELLIFPVLGLIVWLIARAFRRRQSA
jgi:hypothetical protein